MIISLLFCSVASQQSSGQTTSGDSWGGPADGLGGSIEQAPEPTTRWKETRGVTSRILLLMAPSPRCIFLAFGTPVAPKTWGYWVHNWRYVLEEDWSPMPEPIPGGISHVYDYFNGYRLHMPDGGAVSFKKAGGHFNFSSLRCWNMSRRWVGPGWASRKGSLEVLTGGVVKFTANDGTAVVMLGAYPFSPPSSLTNPKGNVVPYTYGSGVITLNEPTGHWINSLRGRRFTCELFNQRRRPKGRVRQRWDYLANRDIQPDRSGGRKQRKLDCKYRQTVEYVNAAASGASLFADYAFEQKQCYPQAPISRIATAYSEWCGLRIRCSWSGKTGAIS